MPLATYQRQGFTATVTLDRADKRNALSQELIADLHGEFESAKSDPAARVVILAANGPVFCAGMDLGELQNSLDVPLDATPVWDDALRLARLYDLIYTLPKPTIAVVQGPAVAGGAGLVSMCDLAIATEAAKFGYPEVRRGIVAAMVMPHLMRLVGERMARYLLLTGEVIDARAALASGFINEIVPAADLSARAAALSQSLAAGGPNALVATKALISRFSQQMASIEEAAKSSAEPRLTDECRQGLRAFFAKQTPPWLGGPGDTR